MAVKRGNSGLVKSGGAVIGEVTSWSYDEAVGVVEKPAVMGETAAVYQSDGRVTGGGAIEIVYDPADVPQGTLVAGATIVLELNETSTSGDKKHAGNAVIGSVGMAGGGSDFLKRSISYSGVLTESAIV